MSYILISLNVGIQFAFVGLLLLLCLQMRSKGVILISVVLLTSGIFSAIFKHFFNPYMDQWAAGEISNWLTQNVSLAEFILTLSLIQSLLYKGLCLLGVFLIYREWRQGKFHFPQPKHREELAV